MFSEPCMQCTWRWRFRVPGASGYCSMCCIHWAASRARGQLAIVTTALPWQPCSDNRVVDFLADSTAPVAVLRDRKRSALYVMLSSPGSLRQFTGWDAWDRNDRGSVEYRRDLLQKIITFSA